MGTLRKIAFCQEPRVLRLLEGEETDLSFDGFESLRHFLQWCWHYRRRHLQEPRFGCRVQSVKIWNVVQRQEPHIRQNFCERSTAETKTDFSFLKHKTSTGERALSASSTVTFMCGCSAFRFKFITFIILCVCACRWGLRTYSTRLNAACVPFQGKNGACIRFWSKNHHNRDK